MFVVVFASMRIIINCRLHFLHFRITTLTSQTGVEQGDTFGTGLVGYPGMPSCVTPIGCHCDGGEGVEIRSLVQLGVIFCPASV
jgi:hypothetical protein